MEPIRATKAEAEPGNDFALIPSTAEGLAVDGLRVIVIQANFKQRSTDHGESQCTTWGECPQYVR